MVRRSLELALAFAAGVVLTLALAGPVQGGVHNCKPAWKCQPAPSITVTLGPTTVPTVISTPSFSNVPTSQPTPPPSSSRLVTSIPDLLTALADNAVSEIVVRNGTYRVSSAGAQASDSLWIGSRFASRTNPVIVRAETPGGVLLDGGGATYMVWIWFSNGAHDQTWDGFTFANGKPTNTGAVFFGERGAAIYDITIRRPTVLASVKDTASGQNDHAFYFSSSAHHLTVEDFAVDGRNGGVDSAFHFFHTPAATDVLVQRGTVTGAGRGILLGEATNARLTFEDVAIVDAIHAVEYWGGSPVTFRRVTSTGSSSTPFWSNVGANPPGVTFESCSFR